MKDRHELMTMSAEEFKNAEFDERITALQEQIDEYKYQRNWCELYSDAPTSWEYKCHKEQAKWSRSKIEEWLKAINIEVLPETAKY